MASDTLAAPRPDPKATPNPVQKFSRNIPKTVVHTQNRLHNRPQIQYQNLPRNLPSKSAPKFRPQIPAPNPPLICFQIDPLDQKFVLLIMVIKKPYLHPPLVMIRAASKTSRQAPKAQKQSIKTTHLARCWVGKNSANNVTDWGTQPILNPTRNLRNKIQP